MERSLERSTSLGGEFDVEEKGEAPASPKPGCLAPSGVISKYERNPPSDSGEQTDFPPQAPL